MAVRLGLGFSRGTPRIVGTILVAVALATWLAGFAVPAALVLAVGATTLLERRRSRPLPRESSARTPCN